MSEEEKNKRGDMLRNAPLTEVQAGIITATEQQSARKVAEQWWDKYVTSPMLYYTEVGEVEINRNSVESSLAHRYSQKKLDAITSLVDGFENAVYIGTMHDSRECWHDRKKNLYFDGYQLEFIEEENEQKAIDWEQRRWELCKEVFIKDRYEYSSPEKAAIEIVKDVNLLIEELKSTD